MKNVQAVALSLRSRSRAIAGALALITASLLVAPALRVQAQSYSVIYSFQCGPNDGGYPYGDLIADSAGNLYGTTHNGGSYGDGTVFELSASGTETVLHNFAGAPSDGSSPEAALVRDAAGNLYGTTAGGGAHEYGTVFEVSASGTETVLHSFTGGNDEGFPVGSLLLDQAGDLYGTTKMVDTGQDGTVFKSSTSGNITVLHTFTGPPADGEAPLSGLIRDSAGDLYGTTSGGGADSRGTVFELRKGGLETVLYSFSGPPDGQGPAANLTRDAAGNLYGTTAAGGIDQDPCDATSYFGCGTLFKVTPGGQETVLYTFTGEADGGVPLSDLVMDPKGNLYGTTSAGGSSACSFCGVVFEVTAAGKEKVLHTFTLQPDGGVPYGGLLHVGNYLYGTTFYGGEYYCGTVYKVAP